MHRLCTYICVCARVRSSSGVRLRGWGVGMGLGVGLGLGLGLGLELVQPPGLPEARQGSPRWRPAGWSSGFLEAKCGGAPGLRGGTPGLQRESVPQPLTPQEGLGLRQPKSWDVGRGLKEREGKEPTASGIPRRSPTEVLTGPTLLSFRDQMR